MHLFQGWNLKAPNFRFQFDLRLGYAFFRNDRSYVSVIAVFGLIVQRYRAKKLNF